MNQFYEKYKDKRVAILGLGLEGQASLSYLASKGLKADVLDQSNDPAYLSHVGEYDIVFRTPGISPLTPEIVAAKKSGTVFTSQIETFFEFCPCKIIGVTGTKGKGTTSTLIYDILKAGGQDAYLGGNIGVPSISFLDSLMADSCVVLELSSFQLQTLNRSPDIAVVLNVTSEHLDYHHDTAEYREAKSNIVSHQSPDDYAVINDDYTVTKDFARRTPSSKYYFSRDHKTEGCYVDQEDQIILNVEGEQVVLARFADLKLRGRHNLENVTAASLASYLAGIQPSIISRVIKEFSGLEHRLELVGEVGSVRYYNDSFSTVPETAIAALDSFSEPVVLIAGGSDKKSHYSDLGKKIADANVKAVILIGEMAEKIAAAIPDSYTGEIVFGLTKMDEMVAKATELASPGDVVLLSPACASFGLFKNYKDRGEQFKDVVKKL